MADRYISSIISLEEFLTSPMNHQVINSSATNRNQVGQAITLRGWVKYH